MIAVMAFFVFTGILFHSSPEDFENEVISKDAQEEMSHKSVLWSYLRPHLLKVLSATNSVNQNNVPPIKVFLDEIHVVLFEFLCNPDAHVEYEERNIEEYREYYDIKIRRLL